MENEIDSEPPGQPALDTNSPYPVGITDNRQAFQGLDLMTPNRLNHVVMTDQGAGHAVATRRYILMRDLSSVG
ncbi:MAG: hypothetical protein EOM12_19050 [Verrucomicrobiae bacterium]|nr:hypothetical protein [Verrucomicrobiae bacterium]